MLAAGARCPAPGARRGQGPDPGPESLGAATVPGREAWARRPRKHARSPTVDPVSWICSKLGFPPGDRPFRERGRGGFGDLGGGTREPWQGAGGNKAWLWLLPGPDRLHL